MDGVARTVQPARDRGLHALGLRAPLFTPALHRIAAKLIASTLQISACITAACRRQDQSRRGSDCRADDERRQSSDGVVRINCLTVCVHGSPPPPMPLPRSGTARANPRRQAATLLEGPCQTARLPVMSCTSTATTASTSNRWMKPPRVYELTTPNSHSSNNTTKSVHNMVILTSVEP